MVTVDIFNMAEDVWPFISAMSDEKKKELELAENFSLGDREVWCLSEEGVGVVVCSRPVSQDFLEYFEKLTGKKVRVWVVEPRTGLICEDIMAEEGWKNKWMELGLKFGRIRLVSYCSSIQFVKLAAALRKAGIDVETPEAPSFQDVGVVNQFGTKSGIRKYGGVPMPLGWVFADIEKAARRAAEVYREKKGVVIKTNKGHAGVGVEIFRAGDLPEKKESAETEIMKMFVQNEYWRKYPIIVEQLVEVDGQVGGGCPNVELKIEADGKVKFLYPCSMRVNRRGEFAGIEIGAGIIDEKVVSKMKEIAMKLGQKYADLGYRGYFEVDFVAGKDGSLLVTESNIRRTGGTHVYLLAQNLLGKNFADNYHVVSNNLYQLPGPTTFSEILEKIKKLTFDKNKNEGVVVVNENTLTTGKLGYVVLGKTRKRVEEIEGEMKKAVSKT
jgi:hypothetical protein